MEGCLIESANWVLSVSEWGNVPTWSTPTVYVWIAVLKEARHPFESVPMQVRLAGSTLLLGIGYCTQWTKGRENLRDDFALLCKQRQGREIEEAVCRKSSQFALHFRIESAARINQEKARGFERGELALQYGYGESLTAQEKNLEMIVEKGALESRGQVMIIFYYNQSRVVAVAPVAFAGSQRQQFLLR
jgi:hypothetical protein